MKQLQPKRLLFFFFCIVVSTVIIDGCRKVDYRRDQAASINRSDQFFKVPADADPTVKRIATLMEKANNQNNFARQIAKEHGMPVWNKTLGLFKKPGNGRGNDGGGGGGGDTLVLIPIASTENDVQVSGQENQVKAFFACIIREDSINVRLFKGNNYKGYGRTNRVDTMSAETVALTCMLLEARAYPGHDTFDLNDQSLFYDAHNPDSVTKFIVIDTTFGAGWV